MIEPILALFEVQVEGAMRDPIELLESALSKAPETLNTINMMLATRELVFTMIDSEVLAVADIYQAVVAAPPVRVDDRPQRDATANNGLQSSLLAVRHNFSVNAPIAHEDAEDDSFSRSATASLAADSTRAEVRFIHCDCAGGEGRSTLTFLRNALSDVEKECGAAAARHPSQLGRGTGRQIEREVTNNLAKFRLRNFRPPVIAV